MQETLSFEAMPQVILELMHKVDTQHADISELKERGRTQIPEPMIGIDEACKILQRAKSTVYALAQAHKIPFYQPGKMLQFKRSELMAWMESARCQLLRRILESTQAFECHCQTTDRAVIPPDFNRFDIIHFSCPVFVSHCFQQAHHRAIDTAAAQTTIQNPAAH